MMLGDVTGKGVGAAALTSLVRYTARTASEFDQRPARILGAWTPRCGGSPRCRSAPRCVCAIGATAATIAVGGHPLPLCLSAEGVREVGTPGTLLGAFDAMSWPETRLR